jgi:CHAD domain-containing protein
VDYLYSLYDALVSINVPNDKARAVVDAMERAMGTTIATKANLQVLRQDLTSSINDLRHELRHEIGLVRKDMELLSSRMTVQLGSMLVVGFGVMIAALKFLLS